MSVIDPPPVPTQLIVFADDWGRHPSSSQHLIRELLPSYKVLWVNTVGTRKPRLSDIGRLFEKLPRRRNPFERAADEVMGDRKDDFKVIEPLMYPGFRTRWQRRFNAGQIARSVSGAFLPNHRHVVVTTLPITADLVNRLLADRWVYYCVDDYSQWPGTDQSVMQSMERELAISVDASATVSKVLADRLSSMSPQSKPTIITHGVDLKLWNGTTKEECNKELNPLDPLDDPWRWPDPPEWSDDWNQHHIALFWGLIDARIEVDWLATLKGNAPDIETMLIGPLNAPPQGLDALAEIPGKVDHMQLPALAERASVLIMPYIDAEVTRAMQPLKLLEYLATMKPVVVRDLPSTRAWADCCDLASTAEAFVELVKERIKTGTPPSQLEARKRRLANESWTAKAAQLAEIINAGSE